MSDDNKTEVKNTREPAELKAIFNKEDDYAPVPRERVKKMDTKN
jgi:hypothetical protein